MTGLVVVGAVLVVLTLGYGAVRGRGRPPGPLVALLMMAALAGGLVMIMMGVQR